MEAAAASAAAATMSSRFMRLMLIGFGGVDPPPSA
jgi:hypothetical protein